MNTATHTQIEASFYPHHEPIHPHILLGVIAEKPRALMRMLLALSRLNLEPAYFKTSPAGAPGFLNFTLFVSGPKKNLTQAVKQLAKLVDVQEVELGGSHE